jgi:heat shock protein HslJ
MEPNDSFAKIMRMRFFSWIFLLTALIACGDGGKSNPATESTEMKKEPTLPVLEVTDPALAGSWVLSGLPQSPTPFSKLYPRQRPTLYIQPNLKLISGSTGCNRFSATITTVGNQLKFADFTRSTLVCVGEAEATFLKAWVKATNYSLRNNDELVWGTDSVTWMVFRRR